MTTSLKHYFTYAAIIFCCCIALCEAAETRNFTIEDSFKIKGVSDAELSPNGKWIAYIVSTPDLAENKTFSNLWLYSVETGTSRQMTFAKARETRPKWSPDSKTIAFISSREKASQIYFIPIDGGEAKQLTTISTGAGGHMWSPDGTFLLFTSSVYPECQDKPYKESDECNKKIDSDKEKSKMKARLLTHLLYRHYSSWDEGKRSHLFMIPVEGGEPKDLTPVEHDVPSDNLSGQDDYGISPDGKEIAFSMNTDKEQSLSTNSDIYLQNIADGKIVNKIVKITDALGADNTLRYSPDGRFIAYRSQAVFGNEAAKRDLKLYDKKTKKTINFTEQLDNWVRDIIWSHDSKQLYFTITEKGNLPLLSVHMETKEIKRILEGHYVITDGSISADGRYIAFLKSDIANPSEIFLYDVNTKKEKQVTNINKDLKDTVYMSSAEEHWVPSADGNKIHTFIVKPPHFQKEQKYGMILLIHGGPQGMYSNSFRDAYQVLSGAGYVLVFSNPRGSTGYGQKFTDEISQDWAGKCYDDLIRVVDYALSLGYVDKERMCAYGGSFGGYMVDWFQGHTDRFACLVSHAGPYNLESMYATTEELWFVEWDLGGPSWEKSKMYETMSPHDYVQNFKTPMLITHGEKDYRVPITESMQLFTALQRNNVPSKFLWFPDEGHGIRKLQNREYLYRTLLAWFHEYLGGVAP